MQEIHHIQYEHDMKKKALREISRDTGRNFRTVRKYATMEDFNVELRKERPRKGKLDPYKETIDGWLWEDLHARPKQRHTAKRVYDRLKEKHGDDFQVSERSVRTYVSAKKKELAGGNACYLPLEHSPAEAQADFGECSFFEKGIPYDGYYINLSFPHSNAGYMQLFKAQNQECLLEGMKNIFHYIGGVPREIWFDNMSTVVNAIKRDGERDVTQGFLRFELHHGFFSNFCNPNSGHEKGHVENKVGYHRRNFLVPVPQFDDLAEFNRRLLGLCAHDMQRKHYRKGAVIADLFEDDRKALLRLPRIPFEVCRLEKAKADNYGKVRFDGRTYSSSPGCAGKQALIKASAVSVEIMDSDYRIVVTHQRLYGSHKESMQWEPYLELMAKRPTALKYTGFFRQLPSTLQDYFDACDAEAKKVGLRILARMVCRTGMESAARAFEETVQRGLKDADSIWAYYCRIAMEALPDQNMEVSANVPEVKKYNTDASAYDRLLKGGVGSWKQ